VHPLLLATRNSHKTREFTEILGREFAVRDLSGELELPVIEETGANFADNAALKAIATSTQFPGVVVVGDDSGLEVDALDGAPGVYSARYAGEGASDTQNVAKLLTELRERAGSGPHSARFRCVLALARDGVLLGSVEGVAEGVIVDAPRGSDGFGYDPVFQPQGSTRTFAELASARKNEISHRARAIHLLRANLLT
jgi:XTP/dITP diphosphohydrolase